MSNSTMFPQSVELPVLTNEDCGSCGAPASFGEIRADGPHSYPYMRSGQSHVQYRATLTCATGHAELRMLGRHYVGDASPSWYRQGAQGARAAKPEVAEIACTGCWLVHGGECDR